MVPILNKQMKELLFKQQNILGLHISLYTKMKTLPMN